MFGLDQPGGPSRSRRLDIGQAMGGGGGASTASRVVGTSTNTTRIDSGRTWGQTMYDVGIYGSALGVAYRLLRPATDTSLAHTTIHTGQAILQPKQSFRRQEGEIGPTSPLLNAESHAALDEALSSSMSTGPVTPAFTPVSHPPTEPPETPFRPLPLAHWSVNAYPPSRRRRNDPSRLSRVSYISTMSTQSSTFSSIDSEWDHDNSRIGAGGVDTSSMDTPESLYLLTPPSARFPELPPDGSNMMAKFSEPKTPSKMVGLGLTLGGVDEDEVDEDAMRILDKLDELLARVQRLTDDGSRALDMGSTRVNASLPVNMSASSSRRKLHTSLD